MFESFYKKLSAPNSEGSVNIVCIGDSVTQGCFLTSSDKYKQWDVFESYTVKLHRALYELYPHKVFNVINSGIGGTTAAQAVVRFDRDVLSYHPDLVIIAFGVNDFGDLALYEKSIGEMTSKLKELGIPCIYMTEHMMNTYSAEDTAPENKDYSVTTAKAQTDGTMDTLFEHGKKAARENGAAVCDVYSKWKKMSQAGVDVTTLLANRINHPIGKMHDLFVSSLMETIISAG